jgi:hypothetical protein
VKRPSDAPPQGPCRVQDPLEVARFLRPQPPVPVPPRTFTPQLPGLLAYALLGHRVVTRWQTE